jgi:hypothetical protein
LLAQVYAILGNQVRDPFHLDCTHFFGGKKSTYLSGSNVKYHKPST